MKKKILFVGLLILSAGMYTSCTLENEEPAGISELRGAKSEYLKAEAAYKLAQAAYKTAETEMENAKVEAQLLSNKLIEIDVKQKELQYEYDEVDYANQIADLERQKEQAILVHEASVIRLQEALAQAQADYDKALYKIEVAAIGMDEDTRADIAGLKADIATSMSNINANYSQIMTYEKYKVSLITAEEELGAVALEQKEAILNKAKLKAENLEKQITNVKGVIEGFDDVAQEIEDQEALIVAAVAQYNADKKELQKLVDAKDAETKALDEEEFDYKKDWFVADKFETAAGLDPILANKLIKEMFPVYIDAELENDFGLTYVEEDSEKIYSFDNTDNKLTLSIPASELVVDVNGNKYVDYTQFYIQYYSYPTISNISLDKRRTLLSSYYDYSTPQSNVKEYIVHAAEAAAAIADTYYSGFPLFSFTEVNLEIYENKLEADMAQNDESIAFHTDEDESGSYAEAVKEYTEALADFIDDPTVAANITNINNWGTVLYGAGYWNTLYSSSAAPTTFVASPREEAEKNMKGIVSTTYGGRWNSMFSLYLIEMRYDLAEDAKDLFVELLEIYEVKELAIHEIELEADTKADAYSAKEDAISVKYDKDISNLLDKLGVALPSARTVVTEIEIEKVESNSKLLIDPLYLAGEDGKLINNYISIYNALVEEDNLESYKELLGKLETKLENAKEDVADAQVEYDNLVANGGTDSTTRQYRDVLLESLDDAIEVLNLEIETEKANIASYEDQIDAFTALLSTEAGE